MEQKEAAAETETAEADQRWVGGGVAVNNFDLAEGGGGGLVYRRMAVHSSHRSPEILKWFTTVHGLRDLQKHYTTTMRI